MTTENGSGSLTFKWLVGILIVIVFSVTGIIVADTRTNIKEARDLAATNFQKNQAKIECVEKEKLDKDIYYRDMSEIRRTLIKIDEKLDRIRR